MEMRSLSSRVMHFSKSFSSHSYDKLERPIASHTNAGASQTDEIHRRSRRRCLIASACCLLAVIAIASMGTVLALRSRTEERSSSDAGNDQGSLSAGSAAIAAACNTTVFPELCYEWLSADPSALKADPLRLAGIAVKVALGHARNASAAASKLHISSSDVNTTQQAVEDCIELMGLSSDQLNDSMAGLASVSLLSVKSSLSYVKVLLSGTMGFQLACAEGLAQLAKNESVSSLIESQETVGKAVSISLGLVDTLSKLGSDVSSWTEALPRVHLRRLLSVFDEEAPEKLRFADGDGFPDWLSAGDRRLLQAAPPTLTTTPTPPPAVAAAPSPPAASSAIPTAPPPSPSSSSSPPAATKLAKAPAATPEGAYDAVVAQDGSGTYTTIGAALANVPSKRSTRYTIYIKAGVYQEYVSVPTSMNLLTLIGDGIGQTIITGDKSNKDGITTYQTATVAVSATSFIARRITFRNTAGAVGLQAVALRVMGDQAVMDSCSIEGYQDTLYALANRQFYTGCDIYGTIDFIFGNAIAVFQDCNLLGRQPLPQQFNTFTAQGRQLASDPSGYSFQKCTVEAAADLQASSYSVSSYYGRPWQAYSRTVFLQSTIGELIASAGWVEWDATDPYTTTVYYGEYQNTGPGANTAQRVAWTGVHPAMSSADASAFTVDGFIAGSSWLPSAAVAFQTSL